MHALGSSFHVYAQAIRLLAFLIFIALGLLVIRSRRGHQRRVAVNLLIAYTIFGNLLVALASAEAWPFSRYPMMAVPTGNPDAQMSIISFRAVDAFGSEWKIDWRAWSPIYPQAVMGWVVKKMPDLPAPERREALQFLLRRAEEARVAARDGKRFGNEALLGALAASDTNLYGDRVQPAPSAFVALRIYRVYWYPMRPTAVRRELLAEQRLP